MTAVQQPDIKVTTVYLVYEDDGWRVFPSQAEQLTNQLLTLTHPLGHKVTGGHGEKCGLCFCCYCLQLHASQVDLMTMQQECQ